MDLKVLLAYSPIVAFIALLWHQGVLIYILLAIPVNVIGCDLDMNCLSNPIALIFVMNVIISDIY